MINIIVLIIISPLILVVIVVGAILRIGSAYDSHSHESDC